MRTPLQVRFWAKVEKTDGCWIWTGSRDHRGYGRLQRGARGQGHVKAHRLSYEIAHGPFDESLFVCHRCDNPSCVNPTHLFLGTHADNMADAASKNRSGHPARAADTEAVIAHYRTTRNQYETARHFGINQATVSRYSRKSAETIGVEG